MASQHPLTPPERLAARALTGSAGHLVAGVVDWLVLVGRYAWARARGRTLS
ncbi:hypothetical protein [Paraconexibacter sp.]|uniref:hypothetical protein n=1 Tax=Paraconexibacter sp. TaxID=2949640 RepID=UPI0035657C4B